MATYVLEATWRLENFPTPVDRTTPVGCIDLSVSHLGRRPRSPRTAPRTLGRWWQTVEVPRKSPRGRVGALAITLFGVTLPRTLVPVAVTVLLLTAVRPVTFIRFVRTIWPLIPMLFVTFIREVTIIVLFIR